MAMNADKRSSLHPALLLLSGDWCSLTVFKRHSAYDLPNKSYFFIFVSEYFLLIKQSSLLRWRPVSGFGVADFVDGVAADVDVDTDLPAEHLDGVVNPLRLVRLG